MPYFAAVLALTSDGWTGREVDLESYEDLDSVVESMRDDAEGGTALLFLEEDDEYLAIVRVDGDADPRTFISDDRVVLTSPLAKMLMEDVAVPTVVEDDEEEGTRADAETAGDTDIVASFGVPSDQLLKLCAAKGMLPADVVTAICEQAGCSDVLDEIREI